MKRSRPLIAAMLTLTGCVRETAPSLSAATIRLEQVSVTALPVEFSRTGPNVALMPDGTVALIDDGTQVVYVIEPRSGQVVRRMGSRGGGPGEFMSATALQADSIGRLAVADVMSRRISIFDTQGQLENSVVTPGSPGRLLRLAGDTVILTWIDGMTPAVARALVREQRTEVLALPFTVDTSLAISDPMTHMPMPFLAFAGRPDGAVLVAHPGRYAIRLLEPGGSMRAWGSRPDLAPSFPSDQEVAEKVAIVKQSMASFPAAGRINEAELTKQTRERPKPFVLINGLSTDELGRLWAVTGRSTLDSTVLDLFNASGGFLQSLSVPAQFTQTALRGTQLAFVSSTGSSDGEGRLFLYRVVTQ